MSDTESAVSLSIDNDIAVIAIDDGKANALSHAVIDDVDSALDDAIANSKVVVLQGRPGKFCAGFDLSVMNDGGSAVTDLVQAGGELCVRLFMLPRPVVAACTGHALAAGAIMLESCDHRIGVDGAFKIGTNEVAIGMILPQFAVDLAQYRLSKRHFSRATMGAGVYSPAEAADVGYLDEVCSPEEFEAKVMETAQSYVGLNLKAFEGTRQRARGPIAEKILTELVSDLTEFEVHP